MHPHLCMQGAHDELADRQGSAVGKKRTDTKVLINPFDSGGVHGSLRRYGDGTVMDPLAV